jgi:hypothetical protein
MKKMQFVSGQELKIQFNKEERSASKEEGSERKGKKEERRIENRRGR